VRPFTEEQADLKKAFLDAIPGSDSDDSGSDEESESESERDGHGGRGLHSSAFQLNLSRF
jgi:hypothetical protein